MNRVKFFIISCSMLLIVSLLLIILALGIRGEYSLHVEEKNYKADKIKLFKTNEKLSFDTDNFKGEKEIPIPSNIDTKKVSAYISKGQAMLVVDGEEYILENGQNAILINDDVEDIQIEGRFSGSIQVSNS